MTNFSKSWPVIAAVSLVSATGLLFGPFDLVDRLAYAQPEAEPSSEATPTPESTPTIEAASELDEPIITQQQDNDDDPPVGCPTESVFWSVPSAITNGLGPVRMLQPQDQSGAEANWLPALVPSGGTLICRTQPDVDRDGKWCMIQTGNGQVMPPEDETVLT